MIQVIRMKTRSGNSPSFKYKEMMDRQSSLEIAIAWEGLELEV